MLDINLYPSFGAAASAVLRFLHQRLGFDLWMVTRTEGNDWIVLHVEDHGYDVKQGTVLRWADSFCSKMVLGLGPCIAHRSVDIPAYAAAPISSQLEIGAYIGVPLRRSDGSLFGTLCAIHPTPQSDQILAEQPLIELLASLLSSLLEAELKAGDQTRRAERAEAEALTDPLTGLYNRRGWDQLLAAEELRCQRYGHSACIVAIDLDGLKRVNDIAGHAQGDELLRLASKSMREAIREQDIAARVGGDEFLILGVECGAVGAEALRDRLDAALGKAQIEASIGVALRHPSLGLAHAAEQADWAMYACKRVRRPKLST